MKFELLRKFTKQMKAQEMKHVVMKLDLFWNVFEIEVLQQGIHVCVLMQFHYWVFTKVNRATRQFLNLICQPDHSSGPVAVTAVEYRSEALSTFPGWMILSAGCWCLAPSDLQLSLVWNLASASCLVEDTAKARQLSV